jgi:transcriptional regulator NrdR family protein
MPEYRNTIAPGPDVAPGLRCPRCYSAWSSVSKSLRLIRGAVRRYRRCNHCGRRFTTLEVPQAQVPREV